MKKIIVGFDNESILLKIKEEMKKFGETDTLFTIKTSKLAVLDAIENENPTACLIMESIGFEHWTLNEIAEIKDNHNIHIVPIISSEYKGTASVQLLYLSGITSAVLKNPKKSIKASEVAKLLLTPRTLKDARIYYGISTLEDVKEQPEKLSDEELEKYKMALRDSSLGATIGQRFLKMVERLTSKQTQYFIDSLPQNDLTTLAECEEFYDVLDVLKKAGIVYKYKKPRQLKKHDGRIKESEKGDVIDWNGEEIKSEDPLFEEEFHFSQEEEIDYHFVEDDDGPEEYAEAEEEFTFVEEEDDEQYGFNDTQSEEEMISESDDISEKDGDAIISEKDIEEAIEQSSKERGNTAAIKQIIEEEEAKEAEKELVNKRTYLLVTFAGIAVLLFVLLILFIHITIQRNLKQQMAKEAENVGFDVSYNETEDETVSLNNVDLVDAEKEPVEIEEPEEPEEIEMVIARHDPPVTVSENGNVKPKPEYITVSAQNSTEQQKNSKTMGTSNVSTGNAAVAVPNTVSDRQSNAASNNRADIPSYNYKPDKLTSNYTNVSFQSGEKIEGLKLINAINSGSGTDCRIRLNGGIEFTAKTGEVSPQDIPIRSTYLIEKKDSLLIFIEQ